MNAPSNLREAIAGQILGEVDGLVSKVEALKSNLDAASKELTSNAATLDEAADRFRMTITAFTEQAKADLSEHLDRATKMVLTQKAGEIQSLMQKSALAAFEAQSWDTASTLADRLKESAAEFRRGVWSRMFENCVVAFLAGLLASALTYGLVTR